MSATLNLLRVGTAAALVFCIAGSQYATATAEQTDIREEDTPSAFRFWVAEEAAEQTDITEEDVPSAFRFWTAGETDEEFKFWVEEEVSDEDKVAAITPDFYEDILEKKQRNSDTIGWIYVPGTDIDQVVLKNPTGESNDYYLNINFEKQPDKNGTYCTDRRARFGSGGRTDLSRTTTIYGHSLDDDPDGEMFAQLKKYRDADFAQEHPYIFFATAEDSMVWEVFAVFDTPTALLYNVPEISDNYFFDALDIIGQASIFSYDIAVSPEDKILTLSTCTFSVEGHESLPEINDYRFAIMARLVDPDEEAKDEAVFALNEDPISPDEIQELLENGAIRDFTYGSFID